MDITHFFFLKSITRYMELSVSVWFGLGVSCCVSVMHLVTTFTIYNEIQVVLYFWQKKKQLPKDSVSHSHMLTQQQKAIAEVTKQTGVHTKLNVLALKMSEFIYLTIHSQLREPQKPQKLYNNQSTKLPLSLSLSLFSAVLSGLLSGSESQNCFLSLPLCSPTKENSIPFSLCLSFCSHCVLPQLRKKTKERLETSVRDQAHSFFFFLQGFFNR